MISLARLRQVLGTPAEKDAEVEIIRAQVLAQWDTATNRAWAFTEDFVETHVEVYPTTLLYLQKFPITELSLVRTKNKRDATWTTLEVDDYTQYGINTLERLDADWSHITEVTYSGGYTEANCPADIKQALEVQARFLAERLSDAKLIVRSQNFEGGGGVFEDAAQHPFFAKMAKAKRRYV